MPEITTTRYNYKRHRVVIRNQELNDLLKKRCCETLDLDISEFRVNGSLDLDVEIEQVDEGSPSYKVKKWDATIVITERLADD